MKKILPFLLFLPLVLFSIYLGFSQSKNKNISKNMSANSNVNTSTNTNTNEVATPTTPPLTPSQSSTSSSSQINLIISSPQSGSTVDNTSVVVSGTTGSKVSVAVNDQELISNTDGTFKTTVLLDEGENYISVVAYDDAGNSAERELLVNRTTAGL